MYKHYFHFILIWLLLLPIAGCRQNTKEKTKIKLAGVVKHQFTNVPVAGIYIELAKHTRKSWPILDWTSWTIHTFSDSKGNYSFDADALQPNESYIIKTGFPLEDTTNIGWKFSSPEITISAGDSISNLTLHAFPEGEVTLNIEKATWEKINADTLHISTPYDSVCLLKGYFESFKCWVEPSQENTFDFWYFNKGKKIKISKRVYVPSHIQPKLPGFYQDFIYKIEL